MKFEFFKKYWLILVFGLVLRLVLSATTYHPDLKSQMVASSAFYSGNFDPYTYAHSINQYTVLDKLPMSYFLDFPLRLPLHFLADSQKEKVFLNTPEKLLGDPWLWGYLIYAKLPYVLADMLIGILLVTLVTVEKRKNVLLLWMLNPFTLWATVMIGQIDVYVALFILLTYIFIKKSNFYLAALALGFGAAVKSAPLLILPLLLSLVPSWGKRLLMLVLSLLPFVVTVLPFLSFPDFRHDALFAPQLTKILYSSVPLSGGEAIFLNIVITLFLYLLFWSKKRSSVDFAKYSIAILLIILSLTHFHLQWILWPLPLLLIWLMDNWQEDVRLAFLLISAGFLGMLFLFESSLQVGLFSPIIPWLYQVKGLQEMLTNDQVIFFRSIAASIFAAGSFYLCYKLINVKQND